MVEYLKSSALQLVGRHNYLNVLASLALLAGAGYDLAQFKAACVQFAGLEHRMQKLLSMKVSCILKIPKERMSEL